MPINEKLAKSLDEIDALAEDILSKSVETTPEEEVDTEEIAKSEEATVTEDDDEIEKGIKADDVSEDGEKDADKGDDNDDEEKDEKEDEDEDEETKKSFVDELSENDTISKSIEVSDFLAEFTRAHGSVIDSLRGDINKSLETSTHTATILAKSFGAIMKSQEGLTNLVKSQASQLGEAQNLIKSLQERLDSVERQPVQRKAVVNTVEKSFNHSAGISSVTEETGQLSKSEKIAQLTQFAMEGKHGVTVNDVVTYESAGTLRPELETIFTK